MSRPKQFKKRRHVTIVMEEEYYEHLKKQTRYMSDREGNNLSVTEVMRRGLEVVYPMPGQEMKFNY